MLGPRKSVEAMISERGGTTKSALCKKADYLCIATESSRDWIYSHEGLKIIKALELKEKFNKPELVQENTLAHALGI